MKFRFIMAAAAILTACSTGTTLRVEGGKIEGVPADSAGVTVYKGIPYAAPPVGENRWRLPQKVQPWEGVRKCDQWGPACIQSPQTKGTFYWKEFYQGGDPEMSEDCLYLNVWTTEPGNTKAKLPVMVWIHGGAFGHGYGYETEFDGSAIAKKGVILVTINYRLGVFGFLAHPLLTAENGTSGNFGLYDQHEAIRWVHDNIAQFGGDPDNITIFGQSAGAMSVMDQISSPLSKGLVAKAVVQSGGGLGFPTGTRNLADAETFGKAVMDFAGDTTLEQMRAIPADSLDAITARYFRHTGMNPMGIAFAPVIDGKFLPEQIDSAATGGRELQIPYMIGYCSEDMFPYEMTRKTAVDWALLQEKQGRKAYVYEFSRDLPGEDMDYTMPDGTTVPMMPGSFHSSELWYVFGTEGRCWRPMEEADFELSDRMVSYWTNFAKTGDPNGEGLPQWAPCTSADNHVQMLDIK